MFCAPIFTPEPLTTSEMDASDRKGGHKTTSTPERVPMPSRILPASSSPSVRLLFIFQLPTTITSGMGKTSSVINAGDTQG